MIPVNIDGDHYLMSNDSCMLTIVSYVFSS